MSNHLKVHEGGVPAGADRPRFSVVIPAVNEASDIGRCLSSLAAQDFQGDYEVIVVDNNSVDETAAIARSHGATVLFEPHPGVCWARQCGTAAARGEIVISTDADTEFDPGWLSRIDRSFRQEPKNVAVTGPCHFVDGPRWGLLYAKLLFGMVHVIHRLTGRVVYVSATNIAFRKSAWCAYDTNLTQGGDELEVLRRLRARGPIAFDLGNPTFTSARRLRRGLVYNIFVTCLYYYILGYALNRMFGRPILGTAPEIRDDVQRPPMAWFRRLTTTTLTVAVVLLASRLAVDAV
ncbi:MAG: glycosyltransferase family 2 protein [Aeromicrobium sp.]|nr:glycosyltransferase family 2 protein [Aeromicrobium sp.]